MGDRAVFDKERAHLGIHEACEGFDRLDLTLVERWWASHCIEVTSRAMLGDRFEKLLARYADDFGVGAPPEAGEGPEEG